MKNIAEAPAMSYAQLPITQPKPPRRAAEPVAEWPKLDPLTDRLLCKDCWNRVHGTKKHPVCMDPGCHCGCKNGPAERSRERAARTAAREQHKAMERAALEDPANPLRASDPAGKQEPGSTCLPARRNQDSN
jgi:hypothetical protein